MNIDQLQKEMEKYKAEMTSSQRLQAYLNGERVDHLPYEIFSIEWAIAEQMGYSIRDLDNVDTLAKVIEQRIDRYKISGLGQAMVLRNVGEALGCKLIYPDNEVERIVEFVMEDGIDMDLVSIEDPREEKIQSKKLKNARILKDYFPNEAIGTSLSGPITVAAGLRPINKLLRDFRKKPDDVHKLLEFCLEFNLNWVRAFVEEFGPCGVNIADPVGCDDILSPKQIAEFSYPYLERLVSGVYEITGKKPGLHVCGHSNKQWESFSKLDISMFSLDNCEDLEEAKKILGDKIILAGNVPPVDIMRYGSIDDVINSVKSCIIKGADSPKGFICATGCDIPLATPIENVWAFIYAISKYGKDARIGEIPKAAFEQ